MLKIIHTGDVHLGAEPDKGFPWGKQRKQEIWDSFRRLIEEVSRKQADLLLIAGDLFHRQPLQKELKEVNYLFSTIPKTDVFLIAGNHDFLKADSAYLNFSWADNVHVLFGKCTEAVTLQNKKVKVYGCSYYASEVTENLFEKVEPDGSDYYQILLAHGGDAAHSPMDLKCLEDKGFHYVALGHIHKPYMGEMLAYCGSLEPLDRNETGPHGYVELLLEENDQKLKFIPFAARNYLRLEACVNPSTTQLSLENKLQGAILEAGASNIYRIRLTGARDPDIRFDIEHLQKIGHVIEVQDLSHPAYDYEKLSVKYKGTLLGDYIDSFLASETSELSKKALFYGVDALLKAKKNT